MTRGTRDSRVWIAALSGLVLLTGLPRVEGAKLLRLPKDRADWETERPKVRRTIATALRIEAPRPEASSFRVLHREARDGIPVETFEIAPDSGSHVRGVLVLPPQGAEGKMRVATLGLDWPSRTGLELQAKDDSGDADKYSSG